MKINTIIFDLDGTLLNTLDDLTAAVDHALGAFGLGALDADRVRRYVGNGVPKLIERVLYYSDTGKDPDPDNDEYADKAKRNACLAVFTEYYDKHNADLTAPYAGVLQMLEAVKSKGLKSAIVTNKYDGAAQALKRKFFQSVDAVVGARDDVRPKPSPDGVFKALEILGEDRSRAVYVGDGETDIATARNAGMPVVAVTWGFRDRDVLKRLSPDSIIDSPDELLPTLAAAGLIDSK